jgi:two-component system chemotaxis response regulator CheY
MKIETISGSPKQNGGRAEAPSAAPTRALVVGDEETMCALIKETLGAANIEEVTLTPSAEAVAQFHEGKFDVILVDLCAPPADAIKLVRGIRLAGFNRKTPVIMISDDLRPSALSEGFKAGASFFVYKPIDRPHLLSLIRVTLGAIEHEKRRFRRVAVRAKVEVKCGDRSVEGETIDLSLSGAFIRCSDVFAVGSHVELKMYLLAGRPPIAGLGSIRRLAEGNKMGIQLERLPAAESGRFLDYLLPLITG